MTTVPLAMPVPQDKTYKRRIFAWTLYDWANSAFATTILAAVLPVYYSAVAGSTLPSEATATAYWSLGLSLSLLIGAIISPILGTLSDVSRTKKKLLATFTVIGVIPTGLLFFVESGDWALASVLFIIARVGFVGAYTFYDSLLPHVARPEDQDSVSARGYAMGYLGGGLLLVINTAMILFLPGTLGARLSFLSVAIWWAVFSIPILRDVPEPATDSTLPKGESVFSASLKRLRGTFADIRRYRELFKYLIAFLIYNDAIGTIIGLATIYGAELGFGSTELILALLLVQFVGIPFSLIFGRLPNQAEKRRPYFLAFIVFNLVALPILGIVLKSAAPTSVVGAPPPAYVTQGDFLGEGVYVPLDGGQWTLLDDDAAPDPAESATRLLESDSLVFPFNGQAFAVQINRGPEFGTWDVLLDGRPLLDEDGAPVRIDGYSEGARFGDTEVIEAAEPGQYTVTLVPSGGAGELVSITVEPPARVSSLPVIIGALAAVQLAGAAFAFLLGKRLFAGLAASLDTRRSIVLALVVYTAIAIWGFVLDSSVEFWFLAWMVAIVQGGSQALSRSLFASMAPKVKSGEFFGLYGIMEKFSSIIGPLLFALAAALFGSSRPAIVSLVLFFIIGGWLLMRVNIGEGQRIAREEDAAQASPA
jgi:MFS transporter, UMF1 family